ncbi:MAG: heat shock protein HspQ [Candidatus Omnitrophota bacterium]|nr:heat shock protein HspQ [Candidatus Omnitrophota bacterium]MDZ4242805.1 heat shock protein HspQ [Candidatus Omnitrophota bacterium]
MADIGQLPHLVSLLDDESKTVRKAVVREMMAFPGLREAIRALPDSLVNSRREPIEAVLEEYHREWIRAAWPEWFEFPGDIARLEKALTMLAKFQSGIRYRQDLPELLDTLAAEFRSAYSSGNVLLLAKFLFQVKNLRGARETYHHPQNSNLVHVILSGEGLPISLSCLYLLVGARLGISVEGYNHPGHFMARVEHNGRKMLVDCYHGGQLVEEKDVAVLHPAENGDADLSPDRIANAEIIIRRVLNNLRRVYELCGHAPNGQLMDDLLRQVEEQFSRPSSGGDRTWDPALSKKIPRFGRGQFVRHKQMLYRGLVVDFDLRCDDGGILPQGQPAADREQPWYHLLVDGSDQVSYIPESHLEPDPLRSPIQHPLIGHFFTKTPDGRWIRNGTPWPK